MYKEKDMCGRYYIDDDMIDDIRQIVRKLDRKGIRSGDVYPSMEAPVIRAEQNTAVLMTSKWGFPIDQKLIINAKAETATQRPLFSHCVQTGRCVIPATGFYEWKNHKQQYRFYDADGGRILYMAGLYQYNQMQSQHVILTTAANASMLPVHDRMPLILTQSQVEEWLHKPEQATHILSIKPPELERFTENEQLEFKFE